MSRVVCEKLENLKCKIESILPDVILNDTKIFNGDDYNIIAFQSPGNPYFSIERFRNGELDNENIIRIGIEADGDYYKLPISYEYTNEQKKERTHEMCYQLADDEKSLKDETKDEILIKKVYEYINGYLTHSLHLNELNAMIAHCEKLIKKEEVKKPEIT